MKKLKELKKILEEIRINKKKLRKNWKVNGNRSKIIAN